MAGCCPARSSSCGSRSTGTAKESEPATVYVDGFTGALYLDKPNEVDRYAQAFNSVWAMALNESQSWTLIRQAAKELAQ